MIQTWFQDLNDNRKKLFNFRGAIGFSEHRNYFLSYSFWSGPSCKFQVRLGGEDQFEIWLGLLFMSAVIKIPKLGRYTSETKIYGFYFYAWALVWQWGREEWGGGSHNTPWWRDFYFRIDDFILGRQFNLRDEVGWPSKDIYFKLGDHEFKMDEIKWTKNVLFRGHLPLRLWSKTLYTVNMDIKNPPMRSGKGESGWDCGDDGCFGLSQQWEHGLLRYTDEDQRCRKAIELYVDGFRKDVARYGSASAPNAPISRHTLLTYIGKKPTAFEQSADAKMTESHL